MSATPAARPSMLSSRLNAWHDAGEPDRADQRVAGRQRAGRARRRRARTPGTRRSRATRPAWPAATAAAGRRGCRRRTSPARPAAPAARPSATARSVGQATHDGEADERRRRDRDAAHRRRRRAVPAVRARRHDGADGRARRGAPAPPSATRPTAATRSRQARTAITAERSARSSGVSRAPATAGAPPCRGARTARLPRMPSQIVSSPCGLAGQQLLQALELEAVDRIAGLRLDERQRNHPVEEEVIGVAPGPRELRRAEPLRKRQPVEDARSTPRACVASWVSPLFRIHASPATMTGRPTLVSSTPILVP